MKPNAGSVFFALAWVVALFAAGCTTGVVEETSEDKGVPDEDGAIGPGEDGGAADAGKKDAGTTDAGRDAGTTDTGTDAEATDRGADAETTDAETDAETTDTGTDAGTTDDAASDGGALDDGGVAEDGGLAECKPGDTKEHACPDGRLVPWCKCVEGGCKAVCDKVGTKSEGWYDCKGQLIRWEICGQCEAACDKISTRSEGWYSSCDGSLINYDFCAPKWDCRANPELQCVTPCSDSCDCPPDKPFCVNGFCDDPITVGCGTRDELCPCGQYCAGNICQAGAAKCLNACECKTGEVCVNETCRQKLTPECNDEIPCPCGQKCTYSRMGATCQKGCVTNCDCPADNPICINGACGKIPSPNCGSDDRNCPCGKTCVGGSCADAQNVCNSSCDCADPQKPVCFSGSCHAPAAECAVDLECPCGEVCYQKKCVEVRYCTTACDCEPMEVCIEHACTPRSAMSCQTSDDCPCKYECRGWQCVPAAPAQCKVSCDCPETMQVCENGQCVLIVNQWCQTDDQCPCARVCTGGFCTPGCRDGCDCPKSTPYCFATQCAAFIPGACSDNTQCPCGQKCGSNGCGGP
ncbi:MAG: hypothetical protein HY897_22720 [Deltaproteobacteria bacterium]|nr:hypothetical protein [Deltaproteobacteria bacterium]